jgi:hypothetical protein
MCHSCARGRTEVWIFTIIYFAGVAFAQAPPGPNPLPSSWAAPEGRVRYVRAFVVDERLSALRREPALKSEVRQRLRMGRSLYILETRGARNGQPAFFRVAVTRRTRGWIHQSAVGIPGRKGEDERVIALMAATRDGVDRIALSKLFIERFPGSVLKARALLMMGQEADLAAASLGGRAHRRLEGPLDEHLKIRDLYLNDPGLDRYSRLNVNFDFDEATGRYSYDGRAFREILKRYPLSNEAGQARLRLERGAGHRADM